MTSSKTILENLTSITAYLDQFHPSLRSAYFEKLIAETFSNILYLPFYTSDNDDPNIPCRLTWQGNNIKSVSKAPPGKPDAIAYCYSYCLIIEATQKNSVNQWTQEFAQSIRHCDDFCKQTNIHQKYVFILLVCTKLFNDTYQSIKNYIREEKSKIIPIEVPGLEKILQASILAFTLRQLDLCRLFHQINDCISKSSSLTDFSKLVGSVIIKWQKDILKLERNVFIGVKSYEVMLKIGRSYIGMSEILKELNEDPIVNQYLDIIGEKIQCEIIENCLIQQSFASRIAITFDGEKLFEPVPCVDFKERGLRLIDAVMRIK